MITVQTFLENMPKGIDQNPLTTPSIQITGTGVLAINGLTLYANANGVTATIDLHNQLASKVVRLLPNGMTGTVVHDGLAELLLLPDLAPYITVPGTVVIATSNLWILLGTIARSYETRQRNAKARIAQLNIAVATGELLDWWGSSLGVSRFTNEPDLLYSQRIIGTRWMPNANNVVIANLFNSLGYVTIVTDDDPGYFTVAINFQTVPVQKVVAQIAQVYPAPSMTPTNIFAYTQSQLISIVNMVKAAGTIATIDFLNAFVDTVSITDSVVGTSIGNSTVVWGDATTTGFTWNQSLWQSEA